MQIALTSSSVDDNNGDKLPSHSATRGVDFGEFFINVHFDHGYNLHRVHWPILFASLTPFVCAGHSGPKLHAVLCDCRNIQAGILKKS